MNLCNDVKTSYVYLEQIIITDKSIIADNYFRTQFLKQRIGLANVQFIGTLTTSTAATLLVSQAV